MPIDYNSEDASNCWPVEANGKPIEYDAELMQVIDKTSRVRADGSGGNPMQEWKVKVFADDGRTQIISDYVVVPAGTYKIEQLSKSLGRHAEFKANRFQADGFVGSGFKVALAIESSDGYPDKNKIRKYLPTPATVTAPEQTPRRQATAAQPVSYPKSRETVMAGQQRARQPLPPSNDDPIPEEDIPF